MKRRQPERALQIEVAEILNGIPGLLWFHVPNGGKRNVIEAKIFKAMGVKPGVPDIIIAGTPIVYHGPVPFSGGGPAFIELKADNKKPSPEQVAWHEELRKRGWAGTVCRSVDEVLVALKRWGYIR